MSKLNGDIISAALNYAELGYRVFPCIANDKKPLTKHGFKDATINTEQIEKWWTEYPQANIGIATSDLCIVDIDGADNTWPDDKDKQLDLSRAPTSLTPSGGCHYLFRQPEGKAWKNTISKLALKVDTRANGGYIIAPPSVVDDNAYKWVEDHELDSPPDLLPEPPEWIVDALDNTDSEQSGNSTNDGNIIPSGCRNSTLASLAGTMRRTGMGSDEILAALRVANLTRCNPPLPETEVDSIVKSISRYEPDQMTVALTEDHYAQDFESDVDDNGKALPDPGPIPEKLLRVPGFISEVMDYCLETAPYPNQVMAFCGALSLQAFLAGRKVRDSGDNRTNIYLLGLAHSAAGKDWPRKLNMQISNKVGLAENLGDRFASGEGIQDALFVSPSMLFQTDEIDGMLQSIKNANDSRHENIMSTLLTIYSSSNSVFPMRRRAGTDNPGVIDQPCLVVFGTAIPNNYYEALSKRMLTNGFFSRMLILESGKRSKGQEPKIIMLPSRILDTTRWWSKYRPGTGNLEKWHPVPAVVEQTEDAIKQLIEIREQADSEYAMAEKHQDAVGTTVWGRVNEHIRKLSLLYAISAKHKTPKIELQAVDWASEFVIHQTRRMLYMAQTHVAENPFHAYCLRVTQKLSKAPDNELSHSVLLKRMNIDANTFQKIIQTLIQQGDIRQIEVPTSGRPGIKYRLLITGRKLKEDERSQLEA